MKTSIALLTAVLLAAVSPLARGSQADDTTIVVTGQTPGPKPFISKLSLTVSDLSVLQRIQFSITPKAGSVTRPLSATYTRGYLAGRGYVDEGVGQITVPVFGLYDAYTNEVVLTYFFADGSSKRATISVATTAYGDPCGYKNHAVLKARTDSRDLSYDFILITSNCSQDSPTVVDTDGAIRWVGTAGNRHYVSTFYDNAVYLADAGLLRIELDGEVTRVADKAKLGIVGLHHNIDPGKHGMILEADTREWVESVLIEIDSAGNVLKKWELGEIIRNAMIAGGDEEAAYTFVRNAQGRYDFNAYQDWFHNNSVTYRRSDDSLIISSRENFVICIDYETGAIKWILGDPNKQWYTYPSLRKYALELTPGTNAPIGQHTVNVTRDDHLLLFDNGQRSRHNGPPYGPNRSYSAPRKYALDLEAKTATEVWNYPNGESVFAAFRSSAYEDAALNYLVNYDVGQQRVLGLSASGEKVFDYRFPGFGYRSIPVHWENLSFPATDVKQANMSARSEVKLGDDVAITGFIVSGSESKTVLLRGIGPSLEADGQPVQGRLMDPRIELYNAAGGLLQSNDNYKDNSNAAAIMASGLAPSNDKEAAILRVVPPGVYTAVLRGVENTTGIALAEVFDMEPTSASELGNLSSRAFTSAGDNVLIGGMILQGSNDKRVLFRALGPSLTERGVSGAVQNPTLELYGADGVKIASNDDWREAMNAAEIERTGIPPDDDRESAILMPLQAGSYTFIARGKNQTQGVASVEAYRLD